MPLVIEKILRAIAGLLILIFFSKNLEINYYNSLIFDSFTLGLLTTIGLLSYRPFVFLNYRPSKKDTYFILLIYLISSFTLLALDNQWWFAPFLLPLTKGSFYLEKTNPSKFYLTNYISVIIFGSLALIEPFLFFLLIVPNILSGLLFFQKFLTDKKKLFNFSKKSLRKFSSPLLLNAVLISIYTKLDVFLIDSLVENSQFKMDYFNSVKVVDYVVMLPVVFISYSFRYWGKNNSIKSYFYDYRFILIASLILSAIAILSASIINAFFTIDIFSFQLYCLVIPFVFLNTTRNNIFLLINSNWKVTIFSVISVVLNLGLSLILYNFFGNYSFLYGTIITQILLSMFSIKIVRNNSKLIIHETNNKKNF